MIKPPKVIIELGISAIEGVGVFAVGAVTKREKVADGIADVDYSSLIQWHLFGDFDEGVRRKIMDFCIGTPEGFIPPNDFDFNKLSVEWYLNHSCKGNCGFNDDGDFIAIRQIEAGEELTYDYGLAESNPNFLMTCACGNSDCRKIITGNDWKDEEFQVKNREIMLPRLRLPIPVHA